MRFERCDVLADARRRAATKASLVAAFCVCLALCCGAASGGEDTLATGDRAVEHEQLLGEPPANTETVDDRQSHRSLPLARPSARGRRSWNSTTWTPALPRTPGRAVIVVGIFAGLVLVWRLLAAKDKTLPSDLVEVYGKVPLNPKQHLHLVRVGQRLLVLIESAQGLQRLAEIGDPEEVRRIVDRFHRGGSKAVPAGLDRVVAENRHLSSFRSA